MQLKNVLKCFHNSSLQFSTHNIYQKQSAIRGQDVVNMPKACAERQVKLIFDAYKTEGNRVGWTVSMATKLPFWRLNIVGDSRAPTVVFYQNSNFQLHKLQQLKLK